MNAMRSPRSGPVASTPGAPMTTPSSLIVPVDDRARAAEEAEHGQPERGLAAAGLADEAHDLAAADREVDAAEDLAARARDAQAIDRQQRSVSLVHRLPYVRSGQAGPSALSPPP